MNYGNIEVHYEYAPEEEDMSGDGFSDVPRWVVERVLGACRLNGSSWTADFEEALENSEGEEEATLYIADLSIICLGYMREEYPEDSWEITCHYSHPVWLLHDLCHASNDVVGTDIYIDEEREAATIRTSIRALIDNGYPIPYDILAKTDEEFRGRFDTQGEHASFVDYARSLDKAPTISNLRAVL